MLAQIFKQFYCLASILLLTLEFPHSIGSSKKEPIWWQRWKEEKFGSKLSVFFDSDSNFDLAKIQRDRSQSSIPGWMAGFRLRQAWLGQCLRCGKVGKKSSPLSFFVFEP